MYVPNGTLFLGSGKKVVHYLGNTVGRVGNRQPFWDADSKSAWSNIELNDAKSTSHAICCCVDPALCLNAYVYFSFVFGIEAYSQMHINRWCAMCALANIWRLLRSDNLLLTLLHCSKLSLLLAPPTV